MARAGVRAGRTKKLKLAVALQYGGGCENCPGDYDLCEDEPTEAEPIEGEYGSCPVCKGNKKLIKDCSECKGTGKLIITECPLKIIDPQVWKVLDMINLYLEKGLPPVAGGQLDQAEGFLKMANFVNNEKSAHKARLRSF